MTQEQQQTGDESSARETGHAYGAPPQPTNGRAKPLYKRSGPMAVIAVITLLLVLAGGWYWFYSQQFESTNDAYIHGHTVKIAPQVAGPVASVDVEENEDVDKGDVLLHIDPKDYRVARDKAQTRLAGARAGFEQAKAKLGTVRAQVEAAEAQLEVARTSVHNARSNLTRLQNIESQYVKEREVDNASDRLDKTRAQRQAAARKLAAKKARIDSAQAGVKDARAAVDEARTGVRKANLQLSYTTITAPSAGQIATRGVETGDYVQPGHDLMSLVQQSVRVKANFKETQITYMQPGQSVDIHVDAYPDETFDGHVVAIQHATGSESALLPPQNASGNFVKVVQRVPVRIAFDERPDVHTLAPGMSVVPTVRVLQQPPWPWRDLPSSAPAQRADSASQ